MAAAYNDQRVNSGRRLGNDRRIFYRRLLDNYRKLLAILKVEDEEPTVIANLHVPMCKERRQAERRLGERRSGKDRRKEASDNTIGKSNNT